MIFIDTNIFLRYLTKDDPDKAQACYHLFKRIEQGELEAWTTDLVIAETVFTLTAKGKNSYNYPRKTIANLLLPLLSLPNLEVPGKAIYPRTFTLFLTLNLGFIDAYNAALIELMRQPELYSYDSDFDKISTVKRLEP